MPQPPIIPTFISKIPLQSDCLLWSQHAIFILDSILTIVTTLTDILVFLHSANPRPKYYLQIRKYQTRVSIAQKALMMISV